MARDSIERPMLTLPPDEAAAVEAHYRAAEVILEYGSGGSTVMAADLPGKTVFSVESDPNWLGKMRGWFAANPPAARLVLHHGDIGPTRAWGQPADNERFREWPSYPLSVWDLPEFVHPDLVLIDGRFRLACFLTTLFRIRRPVTLLWDDYGDRPPYHEVESLAKPVAVFGRMARFSLEPTAIPADRLSWIVGTFLRTD